MLGIRHSPFNTSNMAHAMACSLSCSCERICCPTILDCQFRQRLWTTATPRVSCIVTQLVAERNVRASERPHKNSQELHLIHLAPCSCLGSFGDSSPPHAYCLSMRNILGNPKVKPHNVMIDHDKREATLSGLMFLLIHMLSQWLAVTAVAKCL